MEDSFGFDVGRELLTAVKDMVHRLDLHSIVLMTRRAPTNSRFHTILSKVFDLEDMLFDVGEETSVGFLAPDFQCSSDVLQEMNMADLNNHSGEHIPCPHGNGVILVTGHAPQRIIHVLEFREELHHGLEVL